MSTTEVTIAGSPLVRTSSSAGGSADGGLEVPKFDLGSCDGPQSMQQLEFSGHWWIIFYIWFGVSQ